MKSISDDVASRAGNHDRDSQVHHHPRNDFLGAWSRGKPAHNTGVGMAVIRNPFAGQFVEDLRPLFEAGAMLGERLMPELVKLSMDPQSRMAKAQSFVSLVKWNMAVPASIRCSGSQCGRLSEAGRQ
jgi:hypothetical protein